MVFCSEADKSTQTFCSGQLEKRDFVRCWIVETERSGKALDSLEIHREFVSNSGKQHRSTVMETSVMMQETQMVPELLLL